MVATWDTTTLVEQDIAHMLHPVTNLHRHAKDGPLILTHGKGSPLWDSDGKEYIDGFAGPLERQCRPRPEGTGRGGAGADGAPRLPADLLRPRHAAGDRTGRKLATMLPGTLNHFQFTSGGAESNETALQDRPLLLVHRRPAGQGQDHLAADGLPRHRDGRARRDRHPRLLAALRARARRASSTSPRRMRTATARACPRPSSSQSLVTELEETIEREGAETIAAFIGEPVQGAGGVVVPPDAYWPAICAVLKKHDILFIADEVINGFGRTGTMFGIQQYGVQPDIVAMAKGITSGYIPLGAVGVTDEIYERMIEPDHDVHARLHLLRPPGRLLRRAAQPRDHRGREPARERGGARQATARLACASCSDHPNVGNVRGKGMMAIVEVVADKATKAALRRRRRTSAASCRRRRASGA